MSESGSNPKTRLIPKLIAVGAEWAANTPQLAPSAAAGALAAGHPVIGLLLLGGYAAAIRAKNAALGTTADEAQAGVELYLAALVEQHKTLGKAIEAIHNDQRLHELLSRERVDELWRVLQGPMATLEQRVAEHQELTFTVAAYIEKWREQNDVDLERVESVLATLPELQGQIAEGFEAVKAGDVLTRDQLTRIEYKLDTRVASEGAPHGTTSHGQSLALGSDSVLMLNRCFSAASATVLNWGTTVGVGRHHIASAVEQTVLAAITKEKSSCNLVLGPKGSGKSALSAFVASAAIARGFAVLGIRADRVPATVNTHDELRHYLEGLPVRAADALRLMAARQPTLLIVDQLDSVSELVDRRSERLNLLLNLIRDVSGFPNLHVLAACREFDFRHDSRLSTIAASEVRLGPVDWDLVVPVLKAEGHDPDGMAEPLRDLLRVPWNLDLYLRVASPGRVFASMQSLIEAMWQKAVLNADGPAGRGALLEKLALWMSNQEELFAPISIADDFVAAKDALLREDIITAETNGRSVTFRHQTFYDYALARLFARGTKSLSDHVCEHQDGLFVRPTLINGLELLRDSSRKEYHVQVRSLLTESTRFHIRTLLIESIAQQPDPDDREAEVLLPLLRGDNGLGFSGLRPGAKAGSRGCELQVIWPHGC